MTVLGFSLPINTAAVIRVTIKAYQNTTKPHPQERFFTFLYFLIVGIILVWIYQPS